MSLFDGIIGHEAQVEYLSHVFDQGTLAHAYLFSGPSHLGKRTMARRLLGTFPSYVTLVRPIDEKTGVQKSTIPVESIRDLRSQLSLTTFDGGKKAVLIEDADTMTSAAQNALLKTLEEPRGDTVVILLATHASQLLETIHSRCVGLAFTPVAREVLHQALKKHTTPEHALTLSGYAGGRPGLAIRFLENEYRRTYEEDRSEAQTFLTATLPQRLKAIEALVKEKDPDVLHRRLQSWEEVLHDCLLLSTNNAPFARMNKGLDSWVPGKPPAYWVGALSALTLAKTSLSKNINANLALEQFALHIDV